MAAVSLHFGKIPTELDPEQIHDYLFYLQKKSKSPSQSYFKHTVYGLRFLLKSEGLSYDFLSLPEIKKEKKLSVVLSKQEVWQMLSGCKLLKHKILIGLLYGCGLRCLEVRNLRLCDLFSYKDYRQKGIRKQMVLSHEEFIRRFAMHILPKRFVRIRHYGILSSSWKRGKLQGLQESLKVERSVFVPQTMLRKCRCCKKANLVTIAIFGQRGPPQDFLFVTQTFSAK